MGLISEVKCGKCDKRYSAIRARCPYCGARRGGKGKFAADSDNRQVQIIVAIIIILALIAAVTVLLITSTNTDADEDPATFTPTGTPWIPGENDNVSIDDPDYTPTPDTPTPPQDTPPPALESIAITYSGIVKTDITEPLGTTLRLRVKMVPEGLDLVPEWSSSNPEKFDVVPTDTTGLEAKVTFIARGDENHPFETLTVTVGDQTATCIIRVR
ncbi:MAG: hypothetical protein LBH17_02735 [Oscillospiraceae bacterium]|jgi:DNA-directed RNA polymerase subunit RPC12/RpoP|nr:hypothetical protein [Oscillospiraceae bacterium]